MLCLALNGELCKPLKGQDLFYDLKTQLQRPKNLLDLDHV